MEVKDTLTMPKTAFEMRGNLNIKEPQILQKWKDENLYGLMLAKTKNQKPFFLHDGPPYANGDIHVGHAMNKILKDFIVRYRNMSGFYAPYVPGWDTHGLPIETVLAKQGINRKSMPLAEYRVLCEKYANEQVAKQSEEFQRLGIMGDFANPYITLSHDFEAAQIEIFGKMALDGLIYKGLKPVYWSPSSESALAEAEIEYYDVTSSSIYVAFKVKDTKGILNGDESFVIWTTTPWTIPANLAICLNPLMEYGVYETSRGVFVFLKSLAENLGNELSLGEMKLRKSFIGKDLEGIVASHPLYGRDSLVILGNHVTDDTGTGCVHTAPGHGEDDFKVGMQYHLDILCPVDSKGYMTDEAGVDLAGLFYTECNTKVLELLNASGALLKETKITHSYPHDWRTKKPIIFRTTAQWFCSIEPIREQLLNEINSVKWYPTWGNVRLSNMVKDRSDWCISRQRAWGVPIPIIYAENDTPIIDKVLFDHFQKLFAEFGSNVWFQRDVKDLLPTGYTHASSPNGIFRKETDIMDVWFDSGSSHTGAMKNRGYGYPADLYLEGSDQYRGWFNSSLIIGTARWGHSPYRTIVSHGFVLDGAGNKMSKSLGNTVDPNKVCNQYGADVLRLWVAGVDYQSDVRISDNLLKQVSESYRKIRNTLRFLHGNLSDGAFGAFDYAKDATSSFDVVDEYILNKLNKVINNSLDYYEDYNFSGVLNEVSNFMVIDLSSFYLDITKDILYCDARNTLRRRQVQTVIYKTLNALIRLLTPILPYTCEELYNLFTDKEVSSVQLLDMVKKGQVNEKMLGEYDLLLSLRDDVLKALEESRGLGLIGSSQEATVYLNIKNDEVKKVFNRLSDIEKTRFFIVSKLVETNKEGQKEYDTSSILVEANDKAKCIRCWNRFDDGILNADGLCPRCAAAKKYYEEQ